MFSWIYRIVALALFCLVVPLAWYLALPLGLVVMLYAMRPLESDEGDGYASEGMGIHGGGSGG